MYQPIAGWAVCNPGLPACGHVSAGEEDRERLGGPRLLSLWLQLLLIIAITLGVTTLRATEVEG